MIFANIYNKYKYMRIHVPAEKENIVQTANSFSTYEYSRECTVVRSSSHTSTYNIMVIIASIRVGERIP